MSAVLGPLPLDQPPKSKPVTPMLSCLVSPAASRPQPSPRFTLSRQRYPANSDSRPRGSRVPCPGRWALPGRWGVAREPALGAGQQGDPVVMGEGAAAHGLRGGPAAVQGAAAGRAGNHHVDAAVLRAAVAAGV